MTEDLIGSTARLRQAPSGLPWFEALERNAGKRVAPRFGTPRRLSVALSSALMLVSSVQAADSLADLFLEGRFDGQLRLFYIDRNFTGIDAHRYAFAIGGHLRYDTAIWYGVQLGAAFYATSRMPLGQKRSRVDPSLFGKDLTSYILPAEAHASYHFNHTTVKVGRQQLHTPLVCDDDVRMIPCQKPWWSGATRLTRPN